MSKKQLFIKIWEILFKSIIIITELFFLTNSYFWISEYLTYPTTFIFEIELGLVRLNSVTFLSFHFVNIILSVFFVIIILKFKKINYYPLLLVLPIVHYFFWIYHFAL